MLFRRLVSLSLAGLLVAPTLGQDSGEPCADPLAAILATLDCVEQEDPVCASTGYNSAEFKKFHNELDTNTVIDEGGVFWSNAFTLIDIGLDYNYQMNVGENMASLRYVEIVNTSTGQELGLPPSTEYPFGQTFLQHEHALVTVDNDCKMIRWDQYGDNLEQSAVETAVGGMVCVLAPTREGCASQKNTDDPSSDDPSSAFKTSTSVLLFLATVGTVLGSAL